MLPFHGKYPKLDPKSCVMPGAELAGDVELKEYASIWQNCALRGDVNKIVVGRYSNVQDNSVLHVDDDKACILGDYVTIGHGAIVHASTIEDNVLVGMGAIVLSGCHVGSGSIIAAGAVVKENTVIPPNSLVVGIPARVVRTDETQIERIHNQALKYKHLWTIEYGMLPDAGGEEYDKKRQNRIITYTIKFAQIIRTTRKTGGFMIRDYVANQSKDNNKSRGNHCLGFHNLCGLNFY